MTTLLKSSKQNSLSGEIVIPGDKSISHRAILFGLLSKGKTQIHGSQNSEDVLNSLNVAKLLGIETKVKSSIIFLDSPGMEGLSAPTNDLYFGNSGTGMRLFAGFLSSLSFSSTLTGDASLSKRPMMRIIDPLQKMGAKISATNKENPPLNISPSNGLKGITYKMPIASAQVKSSILLAGLNAEGKTLVQEKYATRDHTERMMKTFEANISSSNGIIEIEKSDLKTPGQIEVPGDFSSAAFFISACLISENSEIIIKNVGINETRKAFLDCLLDMRANIDLTNIRQLGNEEVADLVIKSSDLLPAKITEDIVPNLIDELPLFFLIASLIEGESEFIGLSELKHKESDRLSIMINNLKELDVEVHFNEDSLKIVGKNDRIFSDGVFDSHGDHRIAMTMLVAGLRSPKGVIVKNIDCINTSFPEFVDQAKLLGFNLNNG
ncbi:MAG: 3-phosphoshikimate 1-carboxyvinyltransferase [Gammaproteobacteria bacterium]|tara:strand:- start:3843 stop:5153 length:1311 start_codon:yes stop_codon:yes gene_type:complete